MFDEYIRRTGLGIIIKKENSDSSEGTTDMDLGSESRTYLGLNVHGKKRKDLATKNDPHAYSSNNQPLPLLWQAAQSGAIGIVRYLASDQPLAAYNYYASTHGDSHAKLIRQVPDLAAVLPEKLGWTTSQLNESVATAAIVGGQLSALEALCAIRGKDIENTLHLKFVAFHSMRQPMIIDTFHLIGTERRASTAFWLRFASRPRMRSRYSISS